MLTRADRIVSAVKQLPEPKAKEIFMQLAVEYPEMSVFWDEDSNTATLEDDEVSITVA